MNHPSHTQSEITGMSDRLEEIDERTQRMETTLISLSRNMSELIDLSLSLLREIEYVKGIMREDDSSMRNSSKEKLGEQDINEKGEEGGSSEDSLE